MRAASRRRRPVAINRTRQSSSRPAPPPLAARRVGSRLAPARRLVATALDANDGKDDDGGAPALAAAFIAGDALVGKFDQCAHVTPRPRRHGNVSLRRGSAQLTADMVN